LLPVGVGWIVSAEAPLLEWCPGWRVHGVVDALVREENRFRMLGARLRRQGR
jgi:hypothetical protein